MGCFWHFPVASLCSRQRNGSCCRSSGTIPRLGASSLAMWVDHTWVWNMDVASKGQEFQNFVAVEYGFFPKQVYLYGVLTPFKGLHPWAAWFCLCLRACVAVGRMLLHLSPTCLPHLSPTLGALGRMLLHLSPACLPHLSPTLVSHTCLPHLSPTLVSHSSPTLGALGRMLLHFFYICLPHLSPTLRALGRMLLHLSPTCLPHLSPTLGALGRMLLHLSPMGALGRMLFHLSPTCLPHLSPALCLPLVSHTWLPLWVVWVAWFYTCLPLWVVWAAWSYTCLPLVFMLDAKYVAIRFVPASVSRSSIALFYICLGSTLV